MATKPKKATPLTAQPNTPGTIILQWLTYAFWGWLILGLMWLMVVILMNAIMGESTSEMVPYAVAATVVLLPIAFICDLFYRKYEPIKKTGAATIIMVIHAVLFALIGIGALITSVFIGTNALINAGEVSGGQLVALLSTLFATLLYAAAFLRTLHPFKGKKPSLIYSFGMLGLTIILLVLAIVGPLVASINSRGDRLIESGLPSVQNSISAYISENKALPASLDEVILREKDAQSIVEDGLVEYKILSQEANTYRYELCVEYTSSKNGSDSNYYYDATTGYNSYVDTYSHDAGETCYKLEHTEYTSTETEKL